MYRRIAFILGVLFVSMLSSGCATLESALTVRKPRVSLQGVKFEEITLKSATLLFDVEVENPYAVALPLVNLDYSLASQARPFLTGEADIASTIAPHDRESVSLPVTISYLDLLQALKGIKPGSVIPYSADIGLSVDTPGLGLLRLPMKKEGELSVPTIPAVSGIDWKKMIMDKTE
ncbi:MAG: LEA type 2 family protein [Sedimentisphaerales bacterium]|nr:LEA type 2 family protein [Sedimentisphaerales bacterium]